MQLRYRYRLYPSPGQCRSLARAFGCARVVFNDAVAARRDAHRDGNKYPSSGALQKRLITQAKRTERRAWLAGVSAPMLQQAVRFTHADKFRITAGGKLHLPKVGGIRVAWSRDLPSPPSSVTVIKTADGRFYASFVVEAGDETRPPVVERDGCEVETALDLGSTRSPSTSTARSSRTRVCCAAPSAG